MFRFFSTALIISVILISLGCSGQNNPVEPGNFSIIEDNSQMLSEMDLQELKADVSNLNRNVYGAWKVVIDKNTQTAEIMPARNAQAIGDIFDSDLSQFLMVSPCSNCMRISGIRFDTYNSFIMDLGMKHPFENSSTRPDLHGFDVRAIFIFPHVSDLTFPDIQVMDTDGSTDDAFMARAEVGLLNADGYTSHYDWLPLDERYFISGVDIPGNLNPFLRFFEDYSTGTFDPAAPTGYNVMPVGAGFYERTAVFSEFVFEDDIFELYIVADVAYGQSAVFANRQNPQYYLPAFNRTEPWRVEYWIENNNLEAINPASTADLVVQVFDWQHGYTVDPQYPDSGNLSGLEESSNVAQLELSIPNLQDDPIIVNTPESGTGGPQDPLQYRLTVTNSNMLESGTWGLLAVRDQLHGQASPSGRFPVPDSPAGFPYGTEDIMDYTYYTLVNVNFRNPFLMWITSYHINGELFYRWEDLYANGNTSIAPEFFMDPSHNKFQYRWDYDYDGVTFDVDGSGLPSELINFPNGGAYNVALRVRTNAKPPREYIYELPVFARGEAYENTLATPGDQVDITSGVKNHSAAISSDGILYLVFTHEIGGQRDIFLAIVDREGNSNISQVTNTADISFLPSVYIHEEGPDAGIYVAYSEKTGSDSFIWVTHGNLDGTGFAPANAGRISTAPTAYEIWPLITFFDDSLIVYYMDTIFLFSEIHCCHSDNFGGGWTEDGWCVDNTSNLQYYPTIAQSDGKLYLAWGDGLYSSTNSWDIMMAESSDGFSFPVIEDISPQAGLIYESTPSADFYQNNIAIAYNSYLEGSSQNYINILVKNTSQGVSTHYQTALSEADHWFGAPVIATSSSDRFVVGWTDDNTSTGAIQFNVREIIRSDFSGGWYTMTIKDVNMGVVDTGIKDIWPVIVSRSPQPNVVENYLAWTDYSSGSNLTVDTPNEFLGDVKVSYYITEKTERF